MKEGGVKGDKNRGEIVRVKGDKNRGRTVHIKRDKDGRWTAEIPAIPGAISHGATRKEAATKVAARVLHIVAGRIEEGDLPNVPETILVEEASQLYNLLFEGGNIPNEETIAAIEELENGGGESCGSVEELMARLNADD